MTIPAGPLTRRERAGCGVAITLRLVTDRPGQTTMSSRTPNAASGGSVLFHITQVHSPDTCPRDEGGSNSLYDDTVEGVTLIGRYGANAQHTLFYVVEADDVNAVHQFLWPGFRICTSTITPVSEIPVPKPRSG